jgi:hypothetical protein
MLIETLLRIPSSVIGRCSLVLASRCLQGKCAQINFSQGAASSRILQNHMSLPVSIFSDKIAALGSLKRLFKISKNCNFKDANSNFGLIFSSIKKQKLSNYQRMYRNYLFIVICIIHLVAHSL